MGHLGKILLLICCIIGELLLQTAFRAQFGPFVSPLLHFIFSIGSGIILLNIGKNNRGLKINKPIDCTISTDQKITKIGWLRLALVPLTMLIIAFFLNRLFLKHPINMMNPGLSGSDVIPQIMFFVTRAVSGQYPYQPITGPLWGYTLTPTYMPFQWIPYIPAQLLHFEYRWIPVIILFLALMSFLYKVEKSKLSSTSKWLVLLTPITILICYYKFNLDESINTVEVLVASYYLFLGLALTSKKTLLIAGTIVLCLLSRYAIVLWLPLFFLIYLSQNGIKQTLKIGLFVFLGVLVFYGPFLWKDPLIFIKGYEYYNLATPNEWTVKPWQPTGSYPIHLERGLGFAIYFYKYSGGVIESGIRYLKMTHLTLLLSLITFLSIYYWRNKNRIYPVIFAVASLKIYLTFFYSFIQIPYSYLYILPLLFDVPVLYFALLHYKNQKEQVNHPLLTNT